MDREYGFSERLQFSQGTAAGKDVKTILLDNIPGACQAVQAHPINDRNGTDWWLEMSNGSFLSVDVKVRSKDWTACGKDDLALEVWSVVEAQKIGWSRDPAKRTDFILWLWQDTGRWCLIPFQMLCKIFQDKWQEWSKIHKVSRQKTPTANGGGYHSECVFVPRKDVWSQLYNAYGGRPE